MVVSRTEVNHRLDCDSDHDIDDFDDCGHDFDDFDDCDDDDDDFDDCDDTFDDSMDMDDDLDGEVDEKKEDLVEASGLPSENWWGSTKKGGKTVMNLVPISSIYTKINSQNLEETDAGYFEKYTERAF